MGLAEEPTSLKSRGLYPPAEQNWASLCRDEEGRGEPRDRQPGGRHSVPVTETPVRLSGYQAVKREASAFEAAASPSPATGWGPAPGDLWMRCSFALTGGVLGVSCELTNDVYNRREASIHPTSQVRHLVTFLKAGKHVFRHSSDSSSASPLGQF